MLQTLILALLIFFVACSRPEEADFKKGQDEASAQHPRIALTYFERVVKREGANLNIRLASAREAARLADLEVKDYKRAVEFYRFLVLYSPNTDERKQAQTQIALIDFDHLNDYKNAILEFNRLLGLTHSQHEEATYRLAIAKSYYYLNNFNQAEEEIDTLLRGNTEKADRFPLLQLKANIYVTKKETKKAIEIFTMLVNDYPELAVKENIALALAVAHEDNKNFNEAIRVLELSRPFYKPVEYIDLRIKKLKDRLKNAPGARGLHK